MWLFWVPRCSCSSKRQDYPWSFTEDFGKKLQLNRLTLIVVVDLPGTQPKMYEMSFGKGWHRVRNRITPTFSRLMKKVGIHAPKGTGFYALRITAATIAARSGDPFAVQRLLGHVDLRWQQDTFRMFPSKLTE